MGYKLYQRKTKGKSWYVRFTARGKQFRVTTGETDKTDANDVAVAIYTKALNGRLQKDRNYTVCRMVGDYMTELRRRECVMPTMEVHANFFRDHLGEQHAQFVSLTDIVCCLDKPADKWLPSTYNRYVAFIVAAFNHAIKYEILNVNPAARIAKKKETPRCSFLKPAQIDHVMHRMSLYKDDALAVDKRAAFLLAVNAGIRAGELLSLDWTDVYFETSLSPCRSQIMIRAENSKTKCSRTIPINANTERALAKLRIFSSGPRVFKPPRKPRV